MVIQWREDRGWYHIWFSDSQAALGDYTEDLPGSLPLVVTPEAVAEAVPAILPVPNRSFWSARTELPSCAVSFAGTGALPHASAEGQPPIGNPPPTDRAGRSGEGSAVMVTPARAGVRAGTGHC